MNKEELLLKIETLEDKLYESKMQQRFSKEAILFNTLQEIYEACVDLLDKVEENKRFNLKEKIDFQASIISLKKYIEKTDEDHNLRLLAL